jgi:hypothetical protein
MGSRVSSAVTFEVGRFRQTSVGLAAPAASPDTSLARRLGIVRSRCDCDHHARTPGPVLGACVQQIPLLTWPRPAEGGRSCASKRVLSNNKYVPYLASIVAAVHRRSADEDPRQRRCSIPTRSSLRRRTFLSNLQKTNCGPRRIYKRSSRRCILITTHCDCLELTLHAERHSRWPAVTTVRFGVCPLFFCCEAKQSCPTPRDPFRPPPRTVSPEVYRHRRPQ